MFVEPFSKEWCELVVPYWNESVPRILVDPEATNCVIEFGAIDSDAICQLHIAHGNVVKWTPGKICPDEECDFIFWATSENWRRVSAGKLDPFAALKSRRIHMRKGSMLVVQREAEAFLSLLRGFGRIPTGW